MKIPIHTVLMKIILSCIQCWALTVKESCVFGDCFEPCIERVVRLSQCVVSCNDMRLCNTKERIKYIDGEW